MSEWDELDALLRESTARVTFDSQRDGTKACFRCRRADVPRRLVVVGRWTTEVYGGMRAGDPIERPMCFECKKPEGDRNDDAGVTRCRRR